MTATDIDELATEELDDFERGLAAVLLEAADDDHVMGNRLSDWTGVAPTVEEDVSISNIAQDELGHAESLYEEVAAIIGSSVDELAYGRSPEGFRNSHLVEREFKDWADTIVRQYFFDVADAIRFEALLDAGAADYDESLDGYLSKVNQEEEYHTEHGEVWLETLAAEDDGKENVQRAIDENWVDALAFFASGPESVDLDGENVFAESLPEQRDVFVERVSAVLEEYGYEVPETTDEDIGAGRVGKHTDDLHELIAETREVREQGIDVPA